MREILIDIGRLVRRLNRSTPTGVDRVVLAYEREHPGGLGKRRADSVAKSAERYELINGLLMRRVYDFRDAEVQLRIVACNHC